MQSHFQLSLSTQQIQATSPNDGPNHLGLWLYTQVVGILNADGDLSYKSTAAQVSRGLQLQWGVPAAYSCSPCGESLLQL